MADINRGGMLTLHLQGQGMSVIDYFISTPDIFHIVDQFIVSNFNVYSDHAQSN